MGKQDTEGMEVMNDFPQPTTITEEQLERIARLATANIKQEQLEVWGNLGNHVEATCDIVRWVLIHYERIIVTMSEPAWLAEKKRRHEQNPLTYDVWLRTIPDMVKSYCNAPQYINALEMAYRYCVLEDHAVGTNEIGNVLADALNEAMGPTTFARWLEEVKDHVYPATERARA